MATISRNSIGIDGQVFEDRRREPRHRVLKGGTLTFNNGYGALECVVRNLSAGGARLQFGDTAAVPPRFDLRVSGESKALPARVRWRTITDVGVAFEDDAGSQAPCAA